MTRQVQLSDKAYAMLKERRRPDESFSDVVVRLCSAKDPMSFIGSGGSALSMAEHLALAKRMRGPRL